MRSSKDEGVIDQVISRELPAALLEALGAEVVAAALFGSRAREDAREDSDVDVLVIARWLPGDPFERARALVRAMPRRLDVCFNVLARTPEEFERDLTALHLDLALDARILFDPTGDLASRLQVVRERIAESGLYRDERLVWRWRRPPATCDWAVDWSGVRV